MKPDLDHLLMQLDATPVAQPFDDLEPLVWRRVDALRGQRLTSQLRVGAVAMALVTGLTVGGVGAVAAAAPRHASEISIFTVEAGLSPLVRLEAGR